MEIYLVGGAVRDQLLGYPVTERDYVVVGASPEQMLEKGFRLVGKEFPVFLHPITHEEYALARTERKIGPGYQGFSCYAAPDVTLEADLQRRDLTINAMARTGQGELIDPYHGQTDLVNRCLRHVAPAFVEDPVRILRVARFMARLAPLGFQVAVETMQLMQTMVRTGEVNTLVPERVWREFSLALAEAAPQAFITTLAACGALALLFPVLQKHTRACDPRVSHNTSEINGLEALARSVVLSDDPQVRFAALFCYLGKELSPNDCSNEAGILSIQSLCQHYRIPDAYTALAIMTARYHECCHRALVLDVDTLLGVLEKTDAFRRPRRFEQFLTACEADFYAQSGGQAQSYLQKNRLFAALSVCSAVSIASLEKQGLKGGSFGKALRKKRLESISLLLDTM